MKNTSKKIREKWEKKRQRIKSKLKRGGYPRLVVFRSNKNIYAQIIDDSKGKTITSASSIDKDLIKDINNAKSKIERGIIVGNSIGKSAKKQNISKVVFDRNGYKYHGRIQALANAVRKAGIEF